MITRLFVTKWQQKVVAILIASIIWFFVNSSITATKTIPAVPIRVINLPPDKTILGLHPNGFLTKRVALTLTGTKDVIELLEPGDLEVVLDATNQPNEWIVQLTKKNIINLNPDIDLLHHITAVSHNEFVVKMSSFVTEKIPVTILEPTGSPPEGYQFLDIWPGELYQTVSGPEDQVLILKNKGLQIVFDLNEISKADLDALKSPHQSLHDDEVSFQIPDKWKQIAIPFLNNAKEKLNDPQAKNLQIDFLREEIHPIEAQVPVRVFYSMKNIDTINPETQTLATNSLIKSKKGNTYLDKPLFAKNVSKLFLEVVKDHLEIDFVAAPKEEREQLEWSIDFMDPRDLEDTYVAYLITIESASKQGSAHPKLREPYLRQRFREYMQKFYLYGSKNKKLELLGQIEKDKIVVREIEPDSTN